MPLAGPCLGPPAATPQHAVGAPGHRRRGYPPHTTAARRRRPQLERSLDHLECLPTAIQPHVGPTQCPRRKARLPAKPLETPSQETECRSVCLEDGGREIGHHELFVLVVHTGRDPIQFERLVESPLIPINVRQRQVVRSFARPAADGTVQQPDGVGISPRVRPQLLRVLLPEDRMRFLLGT